MEVVGYTYDAATHCVDCTAKYARGLMQGDDVEILNAIENETLRDSENNPIHPIFSTDEAGDTPDHCDDCGAFIDNSWSGETQDYAVDALWEYVQDTVIGGRTNPDPEVLDIWLENLQWCMTDAKDELIMCLYRVVRKSEHE